MTEHNLDNILGFDAVISYNLYVQKSPRKNRFFGTFFNKLDRK